MTASAFVVTLDPSRMARGTLNSVGAALVFANDSTDAKAMVKAKFGNDVNVDWDNATVTAMAAGADFEDWTLRARVFKPDLSLLVDVSYVGVASDTIDLMAAGIVIALNLTAEIAHAAYNSSSNVLSVTGTADNLGDHTITVDFYPPSAPSHVNAGVTVKQGVPVPGFVGTITDGGSVGDACTAALAADGYTIPSVGGRFKFAG